jgi:hypothetical protein
MKKSTLQTIVISFLLVLSFSAYLYVNTNAEFQISDSEMSQEEEIIEENTETEITLIEAEFLKKLVKKVASNLPIKL